MRPYIGRRGQYQQTPDVGTMCAECSPLRKGHTVAASTRRAGMQGPIMDEHRTALAQVCRGRLVLAMQFWLWRMQAWLHQPSWAPQPGTPASLSPQEENLCSLCSALHLNDEELLQTSPYISVVRTVSPAPHLILGTCASRVRDGSVRSLSCTLLSCRTRSALQPQTANPT